jgi:AcrR family transcriptional regulator
MAPDDGSAPLTGGALTRSRILDAAARLMATVGLARTTTKQIAQAAGYSEAALYKHFQSKEEIFVSVLNEREPPMAETLVRLTSRAGTADVSRHLTEVAQIAVLFYRRSFPMAASLFASPELLAAHRRKLDLSTAGPQKATQHLAAYLSAEQRLGRLSRRVDPDAAATLLLGACFHRAFLSLFLAGDAAGELRPADDEQFAAEAVRALLHGITPPAA